MTDHHTPSAEAHADHAHSVSKHVRTYWIVGATLLAFTAITVVLSYVDFGTQKTNVVIGMCVAFFKAGLVAAIFMHLASEKKMIYRLLVFTIFFAIGLFVLTAAAWYDPISGTVHTSGTNP